MTQLRLTPDNGGILDNLLAAQAAYKLQSRSELHKLQREGNTMAFLNPDVKGSDGNLADHYPDGTPFTVVAAEVVPATTTYGEGEMVIVTVKDTATGGEKRLSVWGSYLVEQARAAEPSDFPMTVRIERGPIEGYTDRGATKRFAPVGA